MNLKDLKNEWINEFQQPMMIAGPCSAESEAQMLEIAKRIRETNA
ncbi:MAG TPA: 3-deoxy-7-phosphoheptulonate synthase, partial [Chryseobacterium sp.]|nr:3-deoxy-7-phosphoheptulonate synthase [Chryseobacterium sp.]